MGKNQELVATAHHEAGHYVANYVLTPDDQRGKATIVSDDRDGSAGKFTSEEGFLRWIEEGVQAAVPGLVEKKVVEFYAGYEAEVRYDPSARDTAKLTARSDNEGTEVMLTKHLGFSGKALGVAKRRLRQQARALVKEHWPLIDALAKELLQQRTIWSDLADVILERAEGKCTAEELEHFRHHVAQSTQRAKQKGGK